MIKQAVKSVFYKIFASNADKLLRKIQFYDVVSFDIFDTLIKRNVKNPQEVFQIVEKRYKNMHGNGKHFFERRIEAEIRAGLKYKQSEISLDNIYEQLEGFLEEEKKQLKNMEIKTELDVCCANSSLKQIYEWCQTTGKKVILISDMYLSSEIINKILDKCGYSMPDSIFVSCEYNNNKATGMLYKVVKSKIHYENWIHIGDSILGDYIMAKKNGLSSVLIKRQNQYPQYYTFNNKKLNNDDDKIFYDFLQAFISNNEDKNACEFEKIGYEILGPMLAGFSIWLHRQLTGKNYDKILFLARDGKLLQKAYNLLFPNEAVNNIYFYTSRKASTSATIDLLCNYDELHDLFIPKDAASLNNLCNALKIELKNRVLIANTCGLTLDSKLNHEINYNKKRLFYECIKYSKIDSKQERRYLTEYIRSIGISQSFAIVDLGWEGRTQWAFQKILNNIHIDGYYIGVITKCPDLVKNLNMFAYMGIMKNTDLDARVIMESIAIFESLFLTTEGSTIRYQCNSEGEILPVKEESEQIESNQKKIAILQNAAIQFIKDIKNNALLYDFVWSSDMILKVYAEFAIHPTLKTVNLLKNLQFRDEGIYKLGAEHGMAFYCMHPKKFVNTLWKSYYRILFLKDLIKLPLPYFELLYLFYRRRHN